MRPSVWDLLQRSESAGAAGHLSMARPRAGAHHDDIGLADAFSIATGAGPELLTDVTSVVGQGAVNPRMVR
jgi:hypothetical protein